MIMNNKNVLNFQIKMIKIVWFIKKFHKKKKIYIIVYYVMKIII